MSGLSGPCCFRQWLACLICLVALPGAFAQQAVQAVRIDRPPKIDGMLDDEAWQTAGVVRDFVQRLPDTGQPVSQKTEVYICYGEKHIYVGFRCYDDPEKIIAKELLRDISLAEDDRVQVIIDPFLDRRNGFWFQVGPRGSIGDGLVSENGAVFNKQWDGLWEGRARIHDQGWDAEMAIPFKTLRFSPGQSTWGLKLIRHIKRRLESSYWPEANLNSYTFQISDAGLLTGLEGLSQGIGLDIRPYALAGLNQQTGGENKYVFDVGGEVFYQISTGLNAALTVNTDFAQTEVDSRQINLTRFALFFPEKRQFFLDGANYFNFGFNADSDNAFRNRMIPYFSRRIGLDGKGNPVPIIAGLKVVGQAGPWNIGALNITDREGDRYRNFTVARISRNIGKQSYVGLIGSNGNAIDTAGNWVAGVDFKLATSRFRKNKNIALTGFAIKSTTEERSGNDYAFGADVSYPNDFLNIRLGHQSIGENYRAGVGFVPRPGIRETYGSFFVGPRPNKLGLLKVNSGLRLDYITDFKGKLLTKDLFLKIVEFEFKSGEKAEYSLANTYEFLDEDFEIFPKDSVTIYRGTYAFWQQGVELTSAQQRNFRVALEINWGGFFDGRTTVVTLSSGWKIGVPFFIGAEYEQNNVRLPEGSFLTHIYRISADVYFSPDISLSNFVQYDNLSETVGIQSRFRWIIKPGNEILLAWNSLGTSPLDVREKATWENTLRFKLNYNFRF